MDILSELKQGNKRAAARLISMVENNDEGAAAILQECWRISGKARVLGITGPPGAGKSTLTDRLAKHLLLRGQRIGILAVDPTSPVSGGAFLGDRVRMSDLNLEPNVFIRSMGTRGALGGIAHAVHGAIRVLEAFGADTIFVETVGVGQSEIDVAGIADLVVLVEVPGSGDDIQAEKAGILEVADVIAVNKADRIDADRTISFLKSMLSHNADETEVVPTIAENGTGIEELFAAIEREYEKIERSGFSEKRRKERIKNELTGILFAEIAGQFREYNKSSDAVEESLARIINADSDPYTEAGVLYREFIKWRSSIC